MLDVLDYATLRSYDRLSKKPLIDLKYQNLLLFAEKQNQRNMNTIEDVLPEIR
jgi:hypothetical protein